MTLQRAMFDTISNYYNNGENLVSLHSVLTAIFILNKLLLKKNTKTLQKQIITFLTWLTVVFLFISLRKLTSFDDWSSLCVHIAMDNTLIVNDISKFISSHTCT